MKILLYGINYSPELTGIGKYSGEMAAWLAAQGHEVRVVTAPPYYPDWKVWQGFSTWRFNQRLQPPHLHPCIAPVLASAGKEQHLVALRGIEQGAFHLR